MIGSGLLEDQARSFPATALPRAFRHAVECKIYEHYKVIFVPPDILSRRFLNPNFSLFFIAFSNMFSLAKGTTSQKHSVLARKCTLVMDRAYRKKVFSLG